MQPLFDSKGWAWSTRILGFIYVFVCLISTILVRSRLPPKPGSSIYPNLRILRQPDIILLIVGMFFMEFALFIPLNYLSSFALSTNGAVSISFAYQLNSILNAGSCLGRLLPGYISDKIGRFNSLIMALGLCFTSTLGIWLPSAIIPSSSSAVKPLVIVFAFVFGFASGSNISLVPVCIGQLCNTQELGNYLATVYLVVSFASLIGIPVAGSILRACNGSFWGMALFTGILYISAAAVLTTVRIRKVGVQFSKKF